MRHLASSFALCFLIGTPALAEPGEQPQQDAQRQVAHERYNRGVELASQRNYAQALREFREAYRLSPHYAVQYNIGQAHIALGQPVEAIAALERYLADGGAQITDSRIRETQSQIAIERALTAEVLLSVNAPNATIEIDGQNVGRSPLAGAVRVAAGTHLVSVTTADGTRLSRLVKLQGTDSLTLQFEVPAAPTLTTRPVGRITDGSESTARVHAERTNSLAWNSSASEPSSRVSTLGYALGIAGLTLGVVAFGDYLWNRSRYEQWGTTHGELQANPQAPDYQQRQTVNNDLASSIQRASNVTVGLSVASGLLTATGVTLLVLDRRGRLAVVPSAQSHAASLSFRGSW